MPIEKNMLAELRELAATYEATLSRTSAPAPPAARAAAAGVHAAAAADAVGIATRLAHPKGKGKGDPYNASSPVLYQTATFELDAKTMEGPYDYTRSGARPSPHEGATQDRRPAPRHAQTSSTASNLQHRL